MRLVVRLAAAVLASVTLLAAPAAADTGVVRDRAGDAVESPDGAGLDIIRASIDNGTDRLRVTVSFAALHRGDLVVCLAHAEYGDLRFALLTETAGGDTDYAPEHGDSVGRTRWIARG